MVRRTHWYLFLLLGTVLGIVSCSSEPVIPPVNENTVTSVSGETMLPLEEPTIDVRATGPNGSLTDIFVKKSDGSLLTLKGLVDVFRDHYKAVQIAGDSVFIVHRTGGSEGYSNNPQWTDSLWVYQDAGSGVKLAEGRGLDARISKDGRFVAIVTEEEVLVLRDGVPLVSKPLAALMPENKELLLVAPTAVGSDYSWFESNRAAAFVELVRLDNDTGAIEHINLENDPALVSYIHAVEPDTGRIVFWDRPFAFDVEGAAELDRKESHIMIFDPSTHKTETLLTLAPGKRLESIFWIDSRSARYTEEGISTPVILEIK